jgi:hypothetical protein
MQATIFGPSGYNPSLPQVNPARLLNVFREPVVEGGQTRYLLRAMSGLTVSIDTPETDVKDLMESSDQLYALIGNGFYRVSGTLAKLGNVAGGFGCLSKNVTKVTMTSGGSYYVWNGSNFNSYTGAFSAFGSVTYLAGRTVLSELSGNRFQWSNVDDPSTLPGLNFASAEQREDNLLRVLAVNGVLMLFGEHSTEIWAATGQGGANAFALIPGAVVDTGIKSAGLVSNVNGGAFLVGSDNVAYIASGTTWEAVSTPAVNAALNDGSPSRCLYWEHLGHKFAAITFSDRPALVFNLATKEWHERAKDFGAWPITCATQRQNQWVFGGTDGIIYSTVANGTDFGGVLYRQATSGIMDRGGQYFTINRLEFGASYGQQVMEQSAKLQLEVSRDGAIWGEPRICDVGFDGDYLRRAEFRRLGTAMKMAFRLTMADPCDISIYSDANLS